MFKGKEEYDFVSKEDCEYIIDYAIKSNAWSFSEDEFWNSRVFYPEMLPNDNEFKIKMSSILKKTKQFISKEYNLKNVYADTFHVVRWFDGQLQPAHQDNMENVMYGVDFFKHRSYGSIIYLNDNFEGGETYYPQYDIAICPKSGKLAVHLGDGDHLHSVNEIKNGTRYTIAAFWGTEKEYDNEY
jgi:hypothetical protein